MSENFQYSTRRPLLKPEILTSEVLSLLPIDLGKQYKAVPYFIEENKVFIAIIDPDDINATDEISFALGAKEPVFIETSEALIDAGILRWNRFSASDLEGKTLAEIEVNSASSNETLEDIPEEEEGQVQRLVNQVINQAIDLNASDIHFVPNGEALVVKFRVDGVLRSHNQYPLTLANGIINRIKILGELNIANRNVPDDGRFTHSHGGRKVDARVVSLPTAWAIESIIIRLLDQTRSVSDLTELGFHEHILEPLRKLLQVPDGLIVVTGPTGSGKTTTLYSALKVVATPERNTLAIEDPVEIRFPSITQIQVNEEANLTFSSALRSFLRADPDVMLIGEMRDSETAALSSQAAQTGHLVLSTLHANNTSATPNRLTTLGLSSHDIATSLRGVLTQRLVRRVCPDCKIMVEPTDEMKKSLTLLNVTHLPENIAVADPEGCLNCDKAGYTGRLVIGELMLMTPEMIELIATDSPAYEILKLSTDQGTKLLHEDAALWLQTGDTTIEELTRIGLA